MNLRVSAASALLVFALISAPNTRVGGFLFDSKGEDEAVDSEDAEEMPHLSPHPEDDLELGADGFDQKAFLGEEAKDFEDMSHEEKVQGLTKLFDKIDEDKNKTISEPELNKWVLNSITSLKVAEATSRYEDYDYDHDKKFGWNDLLYSQFGYEPTNEEIEKGVPGAEGDMEDHKYHMDLFRASDLDKNNELTVEEFQAFHRPEDFKQTQELETRRILHQHDANKDGGLDLKEYLKAELHENDPKDWIVIETERFHTKWDLNKDGVLKDAEIRSWQMPTNEEVAHEEVVHLFSVADENHDKALNLDEILKHHETFGGSQATNYGQHILDEL